MNFISKFQKCLWIWLASIALFLTGCEYTDNLVAEVLTPVVQGDQPPNIELQIEFCDFSTLTQAEQDALPLKRIFPASGQDFISGVQPEFIWEWPHKDCIPEGYMGTFYRQAKWSWDGVPSFTNDVEFYTPFNVQALKIDPPLQLVSRYHYQIYPWGGYIELGGQTLKAAGRGFIGYLRTGPVCDTNSLLAPTLIAPTLESYVWQKKPQLNVDYPGEGVCQPESYEIQLSSNSQGQNPEQIFDPSIWWKFCILKT